MPTLLPPMLIPPSPHFWRDTVTALLGKHPDFVVVNKAGSADFSRIQIIVPAFSHARLFTEALAGALKRTFIPPRMNTLSGLLAMQLPTREPAGRTERLMQLYTGLREHAWLKEMFAARGNTDLLPLAQTLLSLSDELTQTLLPLVQQSPDSVAQRWEDALGQLSDHAREVVSQEATLVQSVWQSQLDGNDPHVQRFAHMLALAQEADAPLIWISPVAPEPMEAAFLTAYAQRYAVQTVTLDWRAEAIAPMYRAAWPEVSDVPAEVPVITMADIPTLTLSGASSLDDAATKGAQTILAWLQKDKYRHIAVVAQDRVMARRLRALLERAEVYVADETGWMLSTTRAAAALAAWFNVVTSRAETTALLDFLKLPFFAWPDKAILVMHIEAKLRRENVGGEWRSILRLFDPVSAEYALLAALQEQANLFIKPRSLSAWSEATVAMFESLQLHARLKEDEAGTQVLALLAEMSRQGEQVGALFQFAEWRVLLNLELDSCAFVAPITDRRVVMLPLNGARLRPFDAVLVMGADEKNLPSKPKETLFFSNAVRQELGLESRKQRQLQQLRDVVELLSTNREVVFCWQAHQNDEPNPVSPWLARLQLTLQKSGLPKLNVAEVALPDYTLAAQPVSQPAPAAAILTPTRLSPSALTNFVACPYQFFAKYMLRVQVMDELSDAPEKRDYGNWLHSILEKYHETVRDEKTPLDAREVLLRAISKDVFDKEMRQYPGALAYYVRWQKVIPAYLDWANEREAAGWYFATGETLQKKMLTWEDGQIELYGRIDRIDQHRDDRRAVLDYKTRNVLSLTKKMQEDEDYQLAFYGLLFDTPLFAAHYVALELTKDAVDSVSMEDVEFENKQMNVRQLITTAMQQVANNTPLPANGIEAVCQYCDVRGFCRKGGWQ